MYIDAGIVGVALSVIIGVVVSIPFIIKMYGARLLNVFKGKRKR